MSWHMRSQNTESFAKYWINKTVVTQYWITRAVIEVHWSTLTDTANYRIIHTISAKHWISHKVTAEHAMTSAHNGAQWIKRMTAKKSKNLVFQGCFESRSRKTVCKKVMSPFLQEQCNCNLFWRIKHQLLYGDSSWLWMLESVWMFQGHTAVIHT